MKAIIVLALLSGLAGAQTFPVLTRSRCRFCGDMTVKVLRDTSITALFASNETKDNICIRCDHLLAPRFDSLVLARLEEYETECYNDSTRHESPGWVSAGGNSDTLGIKISYIPHKIPTLPGFIKWLKWRTGGRR